MASFTNQPAHHVLKSTPTPNPRTLDTRHNLFAFVSRLDIRNPSMQLTVRPVTTSEANDKGQQNTNTDKKQPGISPNMRTNPSITPLKSVIISPPTQLTGRSDHRCSFTRVVLTTRKHSPRQKTSSFKPTSRHPHRPVRVLVAPHALTEALHTKTTRLLIVCLRGSWIPPGELKDNTTPVVVHFYDLP